MSSLETPAQHPLRAALHNEIHARPPQPMVAPLALSHAVFHLDGGQRDAARAHLAGLLRDHHLPPPADDATHLRADIGPFRLRWELHTEFCSWTFSRPLTDEQVARLGEDSAPTGLAVVPQAWWAAMPGQLLAAQHLWALPAGVHEPRALCRALLVEERLLGSRVISAGSELYTDLTVQADGFARWLLFVDQAGTGLVTPRRLGRLVQRVLEIETYRMGALLALPVARAATARLAAWERELADIAHTIRDARREDEPALLDRLSLLAGEVEAQYAATHARYSAGRAYFDLVNRRITEIAEQRVTGLQTVRDFMERRLLPAMNTCDWADRRQQNLSQRISRMSHLLRTRVEVEQQQSSQALLAAMNRRQGLQLKLQATVEGLSVAAITYYIVGLVAYAAKGGRALGWPLSPDSTAALAIPVVAIGVWLSVRRLHHRLLREPAADSD